MMTTDNMTDKFKRSLDRLVSLAEDDYYNPYEQIQWPDSLSNDRLWMSRDLLSVHDTPYVDELTDDQLLALSRWESVNFYTLNVHGIRELIMEVVGRIHTPGFELPSEFFHHFVGEENEHMWFFAQFCLKYGGKIYRDKKPSVGGFEEADVQSFLVFARILMFEEVVDFFNARMAKDKSLPDIVQEINRIHHQDESRHIAFGREIVKHLYAELQANYDEARLAEIGSYVKRYLILMVRSLYNPLMYKDAGIEDPYGFRNKLISSPARKPHHDRILKRTVQFFVKSGILADGEITV